MAASSIFSWLHWSWEAGSAGDWSVKHCSYTPSHHSTEVIWCCGCCPVETSNPHSNCYKLCGSNSANVDKVGCNNLLVNSAEVPVIRKSAPFLIAHLCAFEAWCPLPLFIAHCKKDGRENHITARSCQYSSNRGFFHEQYIMNSLESIEALYLYTYELRKCSHSALLFLLTLATDWWVLCKHSPAHIIKPHLRDKKTPQPHTWPVHCSWALHTKIYCINKLAQLVASRDN